VDSKGVINLEQVRAYQQRNGTRMTEECLRKLGILQQFYNAFSLPMGKELLAEVNSEMVRLSGKVLTDPTATDDDKAMFRAYTHIAQSWAKKVSSYEDTLRSIREAGDK
jgi:hypothetical protein